MTFKDKLRAERERRSLSQDGLARLAGVSVGAVRNYEQGIRTPTWAAVVRLASALGLETGFFDDCDEVTDGEPATAIPTRPQGKRK